MIIIKLVKKLLLSNYNFSDLFIELHFTRYQIQNSFFFFEFLKRMKSEVCTVRSKHKILRIIYSIIIINIIKIIKQLKPFNEVKTWSYRPNEVISTEDLARCTAKSTLEDLGVCKHGLLFYWCRFTTDICLPFFLSLSFSLSHSLSLIFY